MKLYQKIISAVVFIACVFFVFALKTVPNGKIWKEYSVLYVPVSTSDSVVKQALNSSNVKDFVSLSGQYLPVNLNPNSPEISLLKSQSEDVKYSYFIKRNSFFYDKNGNYRLYYIPSVYHSQLNNCVKKLGENHVQCGVDSSASFPWFLPLISLFFAVLLLYFSKTRLLFGCSAFFPVLFVFCNPFFAACTSSILLLLSAFFISNVWKREGFISFLLSNYAIPAMIVISIISGFSCSLKTGFSGIIMISGCGSVFVLYSILESFINSKKSFNPVYIKKAKKVSMFAKKEKIVLPAAVGGILICIILVLINSFFSLNVKNSKIMVPSSKGIASAEIPSMNDYYDFIWNVKSAPYTSLNYKNNSNTSFSFPKYIYENGIVREYAIQGSYDESFKQQVFDEIDILPFNSIESVMKSQNKDFEGHYASTSAINTNLFSVIIIFISMFILLFMYISIIIIKGLRK